MSSARNLDLLQPACDACGVTLPPRVAEALTVMRGAISHCTDAEIPNDTVIAALMTELIPAMVGAYGAGGVAFLLRQMAAEIEVAGAAVTAPLRSATSKT